MAKAKPVFEESVRVGAKHQVTIPRRIARALRLKKGDHLLVCLEGQRLEMVPASLIPKDQLWYWTPEWQAKEREVDEAFARGRFKEFNSVTSLLKELKS
jgi:AbrB family looped-hinge helix DNA binding protein